MLQGPTAAHVNPSARDLPRWAAWAASPADGPLREGVVLGLLVAAAIWCWLAIVDLVTGAPLYTFEAFGGVVVFTVAHAILCIIYGIVVVSLVRSAERTPSVVLALIFGGILFQTACAMSTALLSQAVPVDRAWVRLFGGSLLGSAVTFAWLHRTHHLGEVLRQAEHER